MITYVDRGHDCPVVRAITPIHRNGLCDWCGKEVSPKYEWFIPLNPDVRPFWRLIKEDA